MAGLQNNRGTVRISGLRIEERDLYPLPFQLPENFRCEYTERVTKSPVLRGAGIRSDSTRKDAADLAAYGANLMRWWIRWDVNQPETLKRSLDRLETMLPEYEKLGLKLIPVLAQVPGERYRKPLLLGVDAKEESGRSKDNFRMFFEKKYLDEYVAIWKTIAKRFKDSPAIHGYTLMNEPTQYGSAPYNYLYCQYLAAKAIREIDPEVPLYISANDWDNPIGFSYLKPLPFKNILYEVHMYQPHSYTHQGSAQASGTSGRESTCAIREKSVPISTTAPCSERSFFPWCVFRNSTERGSTAESFPSSAGRRAVRSIWRISVRCLRSSAGTGPITATGSGATGVSNIRTPSI